MKWTRNGGCMTIKEVIERNVGMTAEEFTATYPETKITNLNLAAETIWSAMRDKKRIAIFGDYDADGITASAILWTTIKTLSGADPIIRLPRRFSEGFGFSDVAADEIDADLLITVDNGIMAHSAISKIKAKGTYVIVVDHHIAGATYPDADIIVDPHAFRENEDDFHEWCGAGLAYRLAKLLLAKGGEELLARAIAYITQLAAIGTVCDVMPLIKDNRAIVRRGLEFLNKKPSKGLKALFEASETYNVDETTLGFLIGPVINAAGRMRDDGALLSFDMLTACKREGALPLKETVDELFRLNEVRKNDVEDAMGTAERIIVENCLFGNVPLIINSANIGEGIVGIVAGKLAEIHRVPTIVLTENDKGLLKGSCRSYGGVNVKEMLDAAGDYLVKYGGHAGAGGLTIEAGKLDEAYKAMNSYIGDYDYDTDEEIKYDLELSVTDLPKTLEELSKYAPFGEGNPRVVFKLNTVQLTPRAGQFVKIMGANNTHIKLYAKDLSLLGFGLASKYIEGEKKEITCVGTLSRNVFRGITENQVEMLDFEYIKNGKKSALAELLAAEMRKL